MEALIPETAAVFSLSAMGRGFAYPPAIASLRQLQCAIDRQAFCALRTAYSHAKPASDCWLISPVHTYLAIHAELRKSHLPGVMLEIF